ncbi:MAG TPA: chromate efflux transporter [Longimicrobiaceae bacterium]
MEQRMRMDERDREGGAAGEPERPTVAMLVREFLRISLVGFGGPNAHLALMLDAVVERRRWLDREHFLHLVAMTHLLPGPNSSEVAIHVGYTQRGWRGAVATGAAFLGPTFVLMLILSYLYFRFGMLPGVQPVFWALKPVIVAVIAAAGWRLGRSAVSDGALLLLAVVGAAVALGPGRWQLGVMVVGAAAGWRLYGRVPGDAAGGGGASSGGSAASGAEGSSGGGGSSEGRTTLAFAPGLALALVASGGSLGQLFLIMLGIGATLFGGGYVLVALLQPFAVERYGWLTTAQFLDGVALSQAVPGPISTLAAFVGFAAGGVPGATLATLGIYLPAFAAVMIVAPQLERWRHQPAVRGALRGVNAVVAGAVVGTAVAIAPAALPDAVAVLLLALAAVALVRGVSPPWLILGGLIAGIARLVVGG